MKPNLPAPPSDSWGFRVRVEHESDIDQAMLDQYQYAKPCPLGPRLWSLFRPPNAQEGVPIPGTKGMTLPGDHNIYELNKRVQD